MYNFTSGKALYIRIHGIPSGKLTWQWKITMFNRKYIFKGSLFHCYVSLPEGNMIDREMYNVV